MYVNGVKKDKFCTPLDRKTLSKIKKKNKLWSKARKNLSSLEDELKYNRIRNQVRKLTRQGKKIMEKTVAKNSKTNPKAFWKFTQSKLKTRSTIPDIAKPDADDQQKFTKNDQEKAEVFLNYFSSVFTEETASDDMPTFDTRNYAKALDNIDITQEMVLKKLKKLKINKSPGPDAIHPRVIHKVSESISINLTIIF